MGECRWVLRQGERGVTIKPLLKYRGGKSKELRFFEPFIPEDYDRYVEPFVGGGALFFYLEPDRAIINDLNKKLMEFYCDLRANWKVVEGELNALQLLYEDNRRLFEEAKSQAGDSRVPDANEDLYYEIRDMFNRISLPSYSPATLYYFINKTSYSGMIRYNKKGEFNVPYGRYKHFNAQMVTSRHVDLLNRTELLCGDYQDVFDQCRKDDFVFIDPPYDCVFSDYGNVETANGFTEKEHRRLAEAFFSLPCRSLMVIGKTPLTECLYGRYVVAEYEKSYAVNIRNRFKAKSKHILVLNR